MNIKLYIALILSTLFGYILYLQNDTIKDQLNLKDTREVLFTGRPSQNKTIQPKPHHTYSLKVPMGWVAIHPQPSSDTTMPILHLVNPKFPKIRCDIHSFPFEDINTRIPPESNCKRWKSQYSSCDRGYPLTNRFSSNGFAGKMFQCLGTVNDNYLATLAFSLMLNHQTSILKNKLWITKNDILAKECLADITIKIVGPLEDVEQTYDSWIDVVNSFKLLPSEGMRIQ